MKKYLPTIMIGLIFITLSVLGYVIHYELFHDPGYISISLVSNLAFMPLEVFIVGVIIAQLLAAREKKALLQKLNMVEGAYFSEVGKTLLADLLPQFQNHDEISENMNVTAKWQDADFKKAARFAYHLKIDINPRNLKLVELKKFLLEKREFILGLLENPNILQDERFTDLLWASTHLIEELDARKDQTNLPDSDLEHLAGDVQRMYDHLASEWLDYVEHIKLNYPYLFSLVLRTHPFQANPSPTVIKKA